MKKETNVIDQSDDNRLMSILDFPQTIAHDKYVLAECKGKENEQTLGMFDSEIEALKVYKRVSHDDKVILKADVLLVDLFGVTVLCGYEEIQGDLERR